MVKSIFGIPMPPPPPMPSVRPALVQMPSVRPALVQMRFARDAVERGCNAWCDSQLEDAIASARRFLDAAEAAPKAAP